jgi:hypothetical protein
MVLSGGSMGKIFFLVFLFSFLQLLEAAPVSLLFSL